MFTTHQVAIRRDLLTRLSIGSQIKLAIKGVQPDEIAAFVRAFGKSKKRAFTINLDGNGVIVEEHDPATEKRPPGRPRLSPDKLKYPFAMLDVGESVLIECPRSDRAKIRVAASQWADRNNGKLSCSAEPGGIRVTRTA